MNTGEKIAKPLEAMPVSDISCFMNQLNLSDEAILAKYNLTCEGRTLSEEEARRFLAFVRSGSIRYQ